MATIPSLTQNRKRRDKETVSTLSNLLPYASACSSTSAYVSACGCIGIWPTTITAPVPSTTLTITVTSAPSTATVYHTVSTKTIVSTAGIATVFSTVTTVTLNSIVTTQTVDVPTTVIVTATDATLTSTVLATVTATLPSVFYLTVQSGLYADQFVYIDSLRYLSLMTDIALVAEFTINSAGVLVSDTPGYDASTRRLLRRITGGAILLPFLHRLSEPLRGRDSSG